MLNITKLNEKIKSVAEYIAEEIAISKNKYRVRFNALNTENGLRLTVVFDDDSEKTICTLEGINIDMVFGLISRIPSIRVVWYTKFHLVFETI